MEAPERDLGGGSAGWSTGLRHDAQQQSVLGQAWPSRGALVDAVFGLNEQTRRARTELFGLPLDPPPGVRADQDRERDTSGEVRGAGRHRLDQFAPLHEGAGFWRSLIVDAG